jgi:hypothetical protein
MLMPPSGLQDHFPIRQENQPIRSANFRMPDSQKALVEDIVFQVLQKDSGHLAAPEADGQLSFSPVRPPVFLDDFRVPRIRFCPCRQTSAKCRSRQKNPLHFPPHARWDNPMDHFSKSVTHSQIGPLGMP